MTPEPESIEVSPETVETRVGETVRLGVSVLPPDASQKFTATVKDESIASIESEET